MESIRCKRCEGTGPGLESPPLPGQPGTLILDGTCPSCWQIWRDEQVKLINEHKLSPADPEHYEFLITRMLSFLKLSE